MPLTKTGRRDLEAEVIERCVKAIKLRGASEGRSRYTTRIDSPAIARVLCYLKDRFGIRE